MGSSGLRDVGQNVSLQTLAGHFAASQALELQERAAMKLTSRFARAGRCLQGEARVLRKQGRAHGKPATGYSISLALVVFAAAPLAAQSEPPLPAGRPPEWGLAAGYGFSVHLNYGNSSEHVLLFEPSAGFRVSSRLEYLVEGHFAQFFTPEGYMVGFMPLGGRLYLGHGRTLPYVSIGGGLGWTDLTQLEEIDRRFNFLLQASLGVRRASSGGGALTLEARLSHISNGGTEAPNLGLNSVILLAGWRFR
jgi:hypothetical protein